MYRLYKKNELTFSLLWIGIYVILSTLAENISTAIGTEKIIIAPLHIGLVIFLWLWIRKHNLFERYGLCRFKGDVKKYFYFFPLIIIVSSRLWNGITMKFSIVETMLYILSMFCVGFIEEIIFRGFLFKAMCKDNIRRAILISSITFGIGHIVNLLNGAELLATILQIACAVAIGFLFTIIFYKGKSLLPCIIAHIAINSLGAFAVDGSQVFSIIRAIVLSFASVGYAMWILKNGEQVASA